MRLQLYCVARRPPAWAESASAEYLKRLGKAIDFRCRDFTPQASAGNVAQQRDREGQALLRALPTAARLIVLDERGEDWTTQDLATRLREWREAGQEIVFAIGGAEGHGEALRRAASEVWSLSRLTLPHALARVVVIEQIYRAWSLLNNHPYHRG